jgi:hypothetical protein
MSPVPLLELGIVTQSELLRNVRVVDPPGFFPRIFIPFPIQDEQSE